LDRKPLPCYLKRIAGQFERPFLKKEADFWYKKDMSARIKMFLHIFSLTKNIIDIFRQKFSAKPRQIRMFLNQANRALPLPFPFGSGPRGDVMVGWWPETLCQLMAISPKHVPFRPVPAYHIALPEPKDYGSAA
jgi:hypothetical protein